MTIRERAYAKINLGLRIIRKRPDGYHDIETVLHRIDLYDEIEFLPSAAISVSGGPPHLPSEENLCTRAARLLQSALGVREGAAINLTKNIPVGAGLGGGSSDAAATLLGLLKLWKTSTAPARLQKLALELGSDVPYFLKDGSASASGRGEVLKYFPLAIPHWILVAFPHVHVSTTWAYSNLSPMTTEVNRPPLAQSIREHVGNPATLLPLVANDFEPLVLKAHPEIAAMKQTLLASGAAFAQMSGSGSAVYGLFTDTSKAREAAARLGATCSVFLTPPNFHIRRPT